MLVCFIFRFSVVLVLCLFPHSEQVQILHVTLLMAILADIVFKMLKYSLLAFSDFKQIRNIFFKWFRYIINLTLSVVAFFFILTMFHNFNLLEFEHIFITWSGDVFNYNFCFCEHGCFIYRICCGSSASIACSDALITEGVTVT